MYKKICARLIAALLVCGLCAGCVKKREVNLPTGDAPAEAAAQPAATEEAPSPEKEPGLPRFTWMDQLVEVVGKSENKEFIGATRDEAKGRYVRVNINCVDNIFPNGCIDEALNDFKLRDEGGTLYDAYSMGLYVVGEFDFSNLSKARYATLGPVFDIPADAKLDAMTLCLPNTEGCEDVAILLADIPEITQASIDEAKEKANALADALPEGETSALGEPESVAGLSVENSELIASGDAGLCTVPYNEDVAFLVNGTLDADMQLQSAPKYLLRYLCTLTLDGAKTHSIEARVYENGALLFTRAKDTALVSGENELFVMIKLPHDAAGDYRAELWCDGVCVDFAELSV